MGGGGSRQARRGSWNSNFLNKPETQVSVSSDVFPGHGLHATAEMQGWRSHMEDFHVTAIEFLEGHSLYAVLDGHAGAHVAQFAGVVMPQIMKRHLSSLPPNATVNQVADEIKLAFFEIDTLVADKFGKNARGGATCTGCILTRDYYHIFNIGDSRTVLCANGGVRFATMDHKPDDIRENSRIQRAGGFVSRGRVNGMLAVSRAIGDHDYKNRKVSHPRLHMVSVEPTVTSLRREASDEFLLIACDGVWDVMSSVEAIGWIQRSLAREMAGKSKKSGSPLSRAKRESSPGPSHAAHALERTCAQLLAECMAKGSCDNMSVVVVIPIQVDDAAGPVAPESEPSTPTISEVAAVVGADTAACALKFGIAEAEALLSPVETVTRMKRSLTITSASTALDDDADNNDANDPSENNGDCNDDVDMAEESKSVTPVFGDDDDFDVKDGNNSAPGPEPSLVCRVTDGGRVGPWPPRGGESPKARRQTKPSANSSSPRGGRKSILI